MTEEIKFECQTCGQKLEAPASLSGTEVECPHCASKVTAPRRAEESKGNSKSVRGTADSFAFAALWLVALGVAVIAVTSLGNLNEEKPVFWPVYIGSAMCGLALWCYLLAQVIYIRAAVEK